METIFDLSQKRSRLEEIEQIVTKPGFWDEQESAQSVLKEQASLKNSIEEWQNLKV